MTVQIASVTFDCSDALVVGSFWSAAFGRPLDPKGSSEYAAIGFAGRRDASGWSPVDREDDPTFLFVQVPEGKVAKNRQHFDLRAVGDIPAEVHRLTDLGARLVRDDHGQIVMADPEGNEFCVE